MTRRSSLRLLVVALVGVTLVACTKVYPNEGPNGPSVVSAVTTPTPPPPIPLNQIEFRVNGNPTLAKVRFSDPVDGLTLVTTVLPYSITIATAQTTLFLSLEATPTAFPFSVNVPVLQVQIFANGVLFREASSADFSLSTISASGTWRK